MIHCLIHLPLIEDSRADLRDCTEVPEGLWPMALKGGFSRVTPLQLALDRGMRPGAKLGDELGQLGEYSIKAKSDAEAVCRVLAGCVREATLSPGETSLQALIALFQDVEGRNCPAFLPMVELGLPVLIDLVDAGCEEESGIDPDDVLFALKILVIYGTSEGTDAVIPRLKGHFSQIHIGGTSFCNLTATVTPKVTSFSEHSATPCRKIFWPFLWSIAPTRRLATVPRLSIRSTMTPANGSSSDG